MSASNIITDFLSNHEAQKYFMENGSAVTTFTQYFKGRHELGSLVEICVKMTRKLINAAIGKNILDVRDYEFFVAQSTHLVNRRPIAFKEALRDNDGTGTPEAITPEMLLHGRSLVSINLVPGLQPIPDDENFVPNIDSASSNIKDTYFKLRSIREKLCKIYNEEFLQTLIIPSNER